jgi:hypothetical protein
VAVAEVEVKVGVKFEVEVEVEGVKGVVGRSDTEAVNAAVELGEVGVKVDVEVGEVGVKGSDRAGAAATTDGKAVTGKAESVKEERVRSTDGKTNEAASWE